MILLRSETPNSEEDVEGWVESVRSFRDQCHTPPQIRPNETHIAVSRSTQEAIISILVLHHHYHHHHTPREGDRE